MPQFRNATAWLAIVVASGLAVGGPARAAMPPSPLTAAQVSGFGLSCPLVQSAVASAPSGEASEQDGELEDANTNFSDDVKALAASQKTAISAIVKDHGFQDWQDWAAIGDRISRILAYVSLEEALPAAKSDLVGRLAATDLTAAELDGADVRLAQRGASALGGHAAGDVSLIRNDRKSLEACLMPN